MANTRIQVFRTSTTGRTPNTTAGSRASNGQYIGAGELALNMTDKILYTSDGTNLITVGSNQTNLNVTGNLAVNNALSVNGTSYFSNAVQISNTSDANVVYGNNDVALSIYSQTGVSFISTTIDSSGVSIYGLASNGTGILGVSNYSYAGRFIGQSNTAIPLSVANVTSDILDVYGNGNIGINNTAPINTLSINGTTYLGGAVTAVGSIVPSANVTYNLGSAALYWSNVYANNIVSVNISGNGSSITSVNAIALNGYTFAAPSVIGGTTANGISLTYANVSGQVNTATLYAVTSANVGSVFYVTTGTLNANGIIVNSTAAYVSGYTNATGFNTTGTSNASTFNAGANVQLSSSQLFVGNATINAIYNQYGLTVLSNVTSNSITSVVNTTIHSISNTTSTANLTPLDLKIGTTVVNSSQLTATLTVANLSGSYANLTGAVNAASIYLTTSANIASVVQANASGLFSTQVVNASSLYSTTNTSTIGTAVYFVSNGNVGIANSAPINKLSVNGNSFFGNSIQISSTTDANVVYGNNDTGFSVYSQTGISLISTTLDSSGISVYGLSSNGTGVLGVSNYSYAGRFIGQSNTAIPLSIANVTSDIMDIYSNGNIGIGNTAPINTLTIQGNVYISSNTLTLGTSTATVNGYSYLPNGIKMNWGWVSANSSVGDATFTSAFNTCFIVTATSNSTTATYQAAVISQNTTVASIRTANTTATNCYYMAIGI